MILFFLHFLFTEMDNWLKVPFYSAQLILNNLSYSDILKATHAIPYLQKVFEDTNKNSQSKFIYDQLTDDPSILVTCRELKQIYFKFININRYLCVQLLLLLNLQKKMQTLFIKDDWVFTGINLVGVLQTEFSNLTHLTMEASPTFAATHTISSLLSCCTALKEFTYRNGNLKYKDMRILWHLQKLKLVSVTIEDVIEFQIALKNMGNTLQHLEYFNDMKTTHRISFVPTETIYYTLRYMPSIKTLKLMALKNTHEFKALLKLKHLENLTIVTLKQSYLPKLYDILIQMTIDQTEIEEWTQTHIYPPLNKVTTRKKLQYIKNITQIQPGIKFTLIPPPHLLNNQLITKLQLE